MATRMLRDKLERDFFFGVNYGFLAKSGAFDTAQAMDDVAGIAALNAPWVCVMVNVVQEHFYDTQVYGDFSYTPSDHEVEKLIRAFRSHGIKVMLKLINITMDSYPHCCIMLNQPYVPPAPVDGKYRNDMSAWFNAFGHAVVHYGELMERVGGELLCMSGELLPTQCRGAEWREVVRRVRQAYGGGLTYEFCVNDASGIVEQDWFELLDVLAISKYPLATDRPDPSPEYMVDYMRQHSLPAVRRTYERVGRPLFFAECGCRSVPIGPAGTGGWTAKLPFNPHAQSGYLDALMTVFGAEPWWRGMLWWKWDEQQDRPNYRMDPAGDTGFAIRGKPDICAAIRRWAGRIRNNQEGSGEVRDR